ncbi:hypothetical protein [Sphingomonas asaccharolytica]|uniref:hypothetical protein n=1 Tax=Sphingomonas asaccharolytica TaxID=40681 RepID=UPI00082DED05|nr:hypothetical protein [Sphingomonas asaccharolytica]
MGFSRFVPIVLLSLLVLLVFGPPIAWVLGCLLALAGTFSTVVAFWALILFAERWVDEGWEGASYLEALELSLRDIVLGICRLAHT